MNIPPDFVLRTPVPGIIPPDAGHTHAVAGAANGCGHSDRWRWANQCKAVGRLLADYLARTAPDGVRIALAGRSQAKLEATRAALGARAADWPIVIADADDPVALAELASRTWVVAATVGPYAKYGTELVTAAVAAGTDYVDLTGECCSSGQASTPTTRKPGPTA